MSENSTPDSTPDSSGANPWASPTTDSPQDGPSQEPSYAPPPTPYGQQPAPYGQQPPPYGQQASTPDFGPAPTYGSPGPTAAPYGAPLPPVGYHQQPPAYATGAPVASGANTVMILGIVSLVLTFVCGMGFIPAIIALVKAGDARRQVVSSNGSLSGLTQVKTGVVCSWIALAFTLLFLVIIGAFVAFALATGDSWSSFEDSSTYGEYN